MNDNKRKSILLGMSFGKATHILRKSIMFMLAQKCGCDICYRCNKKIKNIDNLSIEHKVAWLKSDRPRELFFDLENIAFSHLSCNVSSSDKSYFKSKEYLEKISKIRTGSGNPCAKLNEDKVLEIKRLLNEKKSIRCIGKLYNVAHTQIQKIKDGKRWKHVSFTPTPLV